MFRVTNEDIEKLVDKEYEEAIQHGKTYNSDHEFISVLREEIEEAKECTEAIDKHFENIWLYIKSDLKIKNNVEALERRLKDNIKETLQCLAVIKKYKNKEE